jgi:hypothetical protein
VTEPDEPTPDDEYELHTELGHEAKRLARHPVHELERLGEEAREGEADTTIGIVLGGITIVVVLIVLAVLGIAGIAYLLAR